MTRLARIIRERLSLDFFFFLIYSRISHQMHICLVEREQEKKRRETIITNDSVSSYLSFFFNHMIDHSNEGRDERTNEEDSLDIFFACCCHFRIIILE